ncbi:MAG: hypothetical protein ACI8RZ_003893 [Myxococcota bacterium]|jgi:hypothetical protein
MDLAALYSRFPGIADVLRTVSSAAFVLGSILFLPTMGEDGYLAGVWGYLIGSLGFLSASLVDDWRAGSVGAQSVGSGLFVLGSIASAPAAVALSPYPALGLFVAGCVLFLGGAGRPTSQNLCASTGCALFIAGCSLFLPQLGEHTAGAGLFIAGSVCFLLDALAAVSHPILPSERHPERSVQGGEEALRAESIDGVVDVLTASPA